MARRTHSPFVAAVLSGILPGWGQWYVGYRRRGLTLLAISGFAAVPIAGAVIVLFLADGPSSALDLVRPFFDKPEFLFILLAANAAVFVFRVIAALDAFWLAGGGFTRRWMIAIATSVVVLGLGVAVPHAWGARRTLALHDLLTFDYSVDPGQVAAPPDTTTTTTTTTVAVTEAPSSTTSSTSTTTAPAPVEQPRLNVLLLGGDAGPDRVGIRTDTMIVVSIDPATGSAAMLQLPRNQVDLPIPPGHPAYDVWECHCYPRLANTIYQYGLEHPEWFPGSPNSGAQAVMNLTSHLYGIEIHRYALVDLLGFVDVIDALGGLTITVTSAVYDEQYTRPGGEVVPVEYDPGTYRMDGEEVLAFARVRRHADDYARMGRQRCVLQALASQASPVGLLRGLPYLVPALQDSIVTDIPVRDWPDYITLTDSIDSDSIVSVRFMPNAPELVGTGTSYVIKNAEGYWIPNVELIRETVRTVLSTPPAAAAEELGIDPLAEICGTG